MRYDISKNQSGYRDPTAYSTLRKEHDEAGLRNYAIHCYIWLTSDKRVRRNSGVGELIFKTRRQYVRDCLEVLYDEFLFPLTYEDIIGLAMCETEWQIDRYKRMLLNRYLRD